MTLQLPPLMAIVDADIAARFGWTMTDLAAAYLSGGATLLQLRAKKASSGWLLDVATAIVALAHRTNAIVIVNDRADLARLSGADGVHVGQDDLSPAAVRRIAGAEALVGLSTHTAEQLDGALDASAAPANAATSANPASPANLANPVNYIAIGPVFRTDTKMTGYASLGLEAVRRAATRAGERGVPLVAIGGVTLETAPAVIRAGAGTVAVISDLVAAGDPAARVRAYLACLTV